MLGSNQARLVGLWVAGESGRGRLAGLARLSGPEGSLPVGLTCCFSLFSRDRGLAVSWKSCSTLCASEPWSFPNVFICVFIHWRALNLSNLQYQ